MSIFITEEQNPNYSRSGFTIVELLVVIVIIGILGAITIISYTSISQKATAASLQSDLNSGSNRLKMYQVEHGQYPDTLTLSGAGNYCPTPNDTKYCLKSSSGNTLDYTPASGSSPQSFTLDATSTNNTTYSVTNNFSPFLVPPFIVIGNQKWMKYSLNVGTRIAVATNQTNNGTVEKWCYDDLESNCDTYGGLYQWDEMMQGSESEGAQGICPKGLHVPTDNEWKTLEMYLGLSQAEADSMGVRGSPNGNKLKPGGSSGFNATFGGLGDRGSFAVKDTYGYYWSSTLYNESNAYRRILGSDMGWDWIQRDNQGNSRSLYGHTVRCLRDR